MRIALQRELRAGARRSGTYWVRIFACALAALALFQDASKNFAGRDLFFTALTLAFVACVFEGVRRGAGAIADERREGTLGLLFLTALTGPELMLGKFLAIGISALQTALAAAPVMAAGLLLGGISFWEFVRSGIAVWHTLSLSICMSMLGSVRTTDPIRVMTRTWVFLIGLFPILMTALWFKVRLLQWANPMTPVLGITDGYYSGGRAAYWTSLLLYQSLAVGALYLAGRRLFKDWQTAEEARFKEDAVKVAYDELPKNSNFVPARTRDGPRWFKSNPLEWLTLRDMKLHEGRWGIFLLALIAGGVVQIAPKLAILLLTLGFGCGIFALCISSTRLIASLQQSGALELLLTTPMGERGLIDGHRRGLRKIFRWPFVVGYCVLFGTAMRQNPDDRFIVFYILAGVILLAWATPWIGILVGLKAKNPRRAVLWTIFLVMALPRLGFCFLADPVYFLIFGVIARIYVRRNVRRLAAERFMVQE
jgi:hypothetical protein